MVVGSAPLRIAVVDWPLTHPPPGEGFYAEPSHSFSVLQSPAAAGLLAGSGGSGVRQHALAQALGLGGQVLVDQQAACPAIPVDSLLKSLLCY